MVGNTPILDPAKWFTTEDLPQARDRQYPYFRPRQNGSPRKIFLKHVIGNTPILDPTK